jgi:hypothetical protein
MSIFFSLGRLCRESVQVRGPLWHFVKNLFLGRGVVYARPNLYAGGPPLVGCTLLFIQYIHSYPAYLEAVSSIRNLRTRHGIVTRDPLDMETGSIQDRVEWTVFLNREWVRMWKQAVMACFKLYPA